MHSFQKKLNLYVNLAIKYFDKVPRTYYVYGFFLMFLLSIIIELFSFTIINHKYYAQLADKQQISTIKKPVSRGNIYTSDGKGVVATSVMLDDLAIDPSIVGNKEKLSTYLTDIVYNETCYLKSLKECRSALTKFLQVVEIPDFRLNESYIKEKIQTKLKDKISKDKVTSVMIKDDLTQEQSFEIEKMNLAGIYVNGAFLYVNPEEIKDDDFIVSKIISQIGGNKDDLKYKIRKRILRYSPIINKLSISTSQSIKQKIKDEQEAFLKGFIEDKDMIGNFIILSSNQQRFYPEGDMLSSVLGFVDSENEGKYGIEGYYNNILKGKQSTVLNRKDIMGRIIDPISFNNEVNLKGADITLTIDRNIQKAVEDIIDEDLSKYWASSIDVVIMDPKTGAILTIASNPRFNPNNPGDVFELEKVTYSKFPNPAVDLLGARVLAVDNKNGKEFYYDGKKLFLREIEREEYADPSLEKYVFVNRQGGGVYRNHAIQDLYEPGSIFKPIVVAGAIDGGEINRYDMYKDDGFVQIDNFKIKNVASQCMGFKTFQNAMNYSCNVGMIRIAQKIGSSIFHKYIESYGIGKLTGITLEGEVYGRLDPYEKWSKAQLFTTSFGQGITSTMLQMAGVYSTLANGGVYMVPQIVKKIEFPDGKIIVNNKEASHRVIKESTSKTVTQMLVDGVNNGVAKHGAVKGYSIAGKTGTAEIAYKGKYESGEAANMGFFAGFGPAEDPKFVIVVRVERPRSSIWGGETVARTFSTISKYLLNYYKIPPKN